MQRLESTTAMPLPWVYHSARGTTSLPEHMYRDLTQGFGWMPDLCIFVGDGVLVFRERTPTRPPCVHLSLPALVRTYAARQAQLQAEQEERGQRG